MPKPLRVTYSAFIMAMRHWMADPQWVIPNIIAPFVFTFIALTLLKDAGGAFGVYAVLGGGMMGMWGNTLYGSGFAINFERWQGTLEEVLAAPSNLLHVVAGRSIANALFGLVNMVAILLVAILVFQVPLGIADPVLFVLALVLTLLSVSSLGLVFASSFVLTRSAQVLTNGLEFPIYSISGSMFPVFLLPFWIHPVSYALGPTWGVDAIRGAAGSAAGSRFFPYWVDIYFMMVFTLVYLVIAAFLFKKVESRVRKYGTLMEA
jgi:ABC-2 type transport system permease protein